MLSVLTIWKYNPPQVAKALISRGCKTILIKDISYPSLKQFKILPTVLSVFVIVNILDLFTNLKVINVKYWYKT